MGSFTENKTWRKSNPVAPIYMSHSVALARAERRVCRARRVAARIVSSNASSVTVEANSMIKVRAAPSSRGRAARVVCLDHTSDTRTSILDLEHG